MKTRCHPLAGVSTLCQHHSGACICTPHSWTRNRPFPHQPVAAGLTEQGEHYREQHLVRGSSAKLLTACQGRVALIHIPEEPQHPWSCCREAKSEQAAQGILSQQFRLSCLCFSVYGITLHGLKEHAIASTGEKKEGDTSQSEQENVNKPHPLVNVDIMNTETMVTLWR